MELRVDATVPYGNACDVSVHEEGGMPVASFAERTPVLLPFDVEPPSGALIEFLQSFQNRRMGN